MEWVSFQITIFISSYKVSIVASRKEDKYEVKTVKAKDIKESGARSRPTSPVGFSEYIPKEKYDDDSCKLSLQCFKNKLPKIFPSSSSNFPKK